MIGVIVFFLQLNSYEMICYVSYVCFFVISYRSNFNFR